MNKPENQTFNLDKWHAFILQLQDDICQELEVADGHATFVEEMWERDGGGGGRTRVINGNIIEKGGVNTSRVYGEVTPQMRNLIGDKGSAWAACGLSMVIHPMNPMAPTFHANWRYFELYDEAGNIIDQWFGGGMDLTPYYLDHDDASLFHSEIKKALDPFGTSLYRTFKKECDEYFNNHHRGTETRGIGGVFYDHLRPNDAYGMSLETLYEFQQANAATFFKTYLPILNKNKNLPYTEANKYWQEIRRGRYVEFNLLHDRGTLFGLKTNGRTESILMSLPATVRFDYNYQTAPGSAEAEFLAVLQSPREWVK